LTRYPGSKGGEGVWQRIISEMPPHTIYIEAFLGSGVILRKKRPAAALSVGIDADSAVVESFSAGNSGAGPAAPLIICDEARSLLARWPWKGGELVYADPPYLMETRSSKRAYYRKEFTEDDHRALLSVLRGLPCLVMVSGYWSEMYAAALADWRAVQIPTVNRAGRRVVEWLWCNFPEPDELHDYRFLGANFRERERIRKKSKRWMSRLAGLNAVERSALRVALNLAPSTEVMRYQMPYPITGTGGERSPAASPEPVSGDGAAHHNWR
jgi:hypothetical protein